MTQQLELAYYPPDCVRGVLSAFLAMKAETVTKETLEEDYWYRAAWLMDMLGEFTAAAVVTYSRLEEVARAARGLLRDITIKKRIDFWRWSMEYAALRGVVAEATVPKASPPWLRNDGKRCEDHYTPTQFQAFRLSLAPGRFRRFADLGFWTGQHTLDICSMACWMLQPEHPWPHPTDPSETIHIGRWWRRNHKNKKCIPTWIPMEPELRKVAQEWLAESRHPDSLVVGAVSNLRRTFHTAASRAELPPIRPNLGLRASHSTLLMARWDSYEYVRQVLGHQGEVSAEAIATGELVARTAKRASTLTSHYLRPSFEMLIPRRR